MGKTPAVKQHDTVQGNNKSDGKISIHFTPLFIDQIYIRDNFILDDDLSTWKYFFIIDTEISLRKKDYVKMH